MDKYTIYQLKDDPIYRNVIFESYDFVQNQGLVPNISDYNEVYSGDLSTFSGARGDYLLEDIYEKFNFDHPADFTGHSLSMSDVVVLHYDEAIENKNDFVYYVDRFGFTELPETFLEHSTPTQEIETIQSLSDRRDELVSQITAAQDFYNLRLNEDFAVDGNIDELANFRNQVTEDIRNMENELSGVNERLQVLLDAQEEEYYRQSDLSFKDVALQLLEEIGYEVVENDNFKDFIFVGEKNRTDDNNVTGYDGWEMIFNHFNDVKKTLELMNKFGYEMVSESPFKIVIKYKDADFPFNPEFNSWTELKNDLESVEEFANSHSLKELIDIRDLQTDLKYGYVYRKPTDNGFEEIILSYNQVSDAARYKTGLEINATKQSDRKVFLTGLPVSEKMKDIINDLEHGNDVPIEEIQATTEIQTAFTCISHATPTHMIMGREKIQNNIFNKMINLGSAVVDDSTNVQYNGNVKKDRRLDIVIGLPGSGKSSALVDVISAETKALVIDNDNIKKLIPEFNNGWGSDIVHEESKLIERRVFMNSLKAGKNVVIPKVGGSTRDMVDNYIIPAVAIGYTVNVHYVELSREKALSRMLNRFIDTGKYQNPAIMDKYVNENQGNLIEQTFIHLKDSGLMTGISHWNNDVKLGEKPILIHSEGLDDNFIKEARTYDKIHDSLVNDQKGEEYGSYSKAAETDAKDLNSDAERDKEQLHKSGDGGLLRRSGEESLPGGEQEPDVHPVDERRGVQRASEKALGGEKNRSNVGVTGSLLSKLNDSINRANSNSSDKNRNIDLSKYRDELA